MDLCFMFTFEYSFHLAKMPISTEEYLMDSFLVQAIYLLSKFSDRNSSRSRNFIWQN